MTNLSAIRDHWNDRASLGDTAGTQDLILKQLEQRAILAELDAYQATRGGCLWALEIGCGLGELALRVAQTLPIHVWAIDQAPAMIHAARARLAASAGELFCGGLAYDEGDVAHLPQGPFDVIYTERMLINLPTWELQKQAIDAMADRLVVGGRFLMCEHSQDGLDAINETRVALGLMAIEPPWHNRYLRGHELAQVKSLTLVKTVPFSATYYFLSRIVNAYVAQREHRAPAYDAPINQLALTLSDVAAPQYAQGRLWIWEKR